MGENYVRKSKYCPYGIALQKDGNLEKFMNYIENGLDNGDNLETVVKRLTAETKSSSFTVLFSVIRHFLPYYYGKDKWPNIRETSRNKWKVIENLLFLKQNDSLARFILEEIIEKSDYLNKKGCKNASQLLEKEIEFYRKKKMLRKSKKSTENFRRKNAVGTAETNTAGTIGVDDVNDSEELTEDDVLGIESIENTVETNTADTTGINTTNDLKELEETAQNMNLVIEGIGMNNLVRWDQFIEPLCAPMIYKPSSLDPEIEL